METDTRLKENFISRAYFEKDPNVDQSKWIDDLKNKQMHSEMQDKVRSGIITSKNAIAIIQNQLIADHAL